MPLDILYVSASDGSTVRESTCTKPRIDDEDDDDDKANTENSTQNQNQNECANVNKLDASTIAQSNPFIKSKFHISDNNSSFKFNFSIECD